MTENPNRSGNRHAKLNKRTVSALAKPSKSAETTLAATNGRFTVWDTDLRGFGLRVEPSGAMSYLVRYRPRGSSRQRQLSLGRHGALSPDKAREAAKRALGAVANGRDPLEELGAVRDALTMRELTNRFLKEHTEKKLKSRTSGGYRWILEKYVLPRLGSRRVLEMKEADISRLHSDLSETPFQANRVLAVLGSLFSWARRRRLVPESFNPTRHVEKYPEHSRERYLTRDELERLGAAIRLGETIGFPRKSRSDKRAPKEELRDVVSPYAAAAIRLLLFTGARLGEVLNLRWDEVDFERQALFLRDSKTGSKTITLNAPAMAVLTGLPKVQENPFVIVGTREKQHLADLKKPWAAVLDHANLTGVRLHDLRHTYASYGAAANMGLPVIGKLLGHSSSQTTARYSHLADDPLRRASRSIADTIASAMGEKTQDSEAEIVAFRNSQA